MDLIPVADFFAEFYQKLLPTFFKSTIPPETAASCSDCAMLPPKERASKIADGYYYSSKSKCCTHYPNLPNYLVGAILDNDDAAFNHDANRTTEKFNAKSGFEGQKI